MVEDLNLPNVDWLNGLVVSPINSISQHFNIQNEFVYNKSIELVYRRYLI